MSSPLSPRSSVLILSPPLALAREALPDPCPGCGAVLAPVWTHGGPSPGPIAVAVPRVPDRPVLVEAVEHRCGARGECPGHGRGGTARPCCERAGEYNGFGSDGPLLFRCPAGCSCHD